MADPTPMRWAEPRDGDRIARYHRACWHAAFEPLVSPEVMAFVEASPIEELHAVWANRLAPDSSAQVVVATGSDDEAIGHVMTVGNELVHLFIDPQHHGRGIGRQLLEVGERLIRRAGHEQAQLHTIVGNTPAISLYESCGWLLTEETEDENLPNGSSYTEHIMRKDFASTTHVEANRDTWDGDADNWIDRGRRSWASKPHWGEMSVAESEIHALPDLEGRDVIELGCGTGYVSAWCLAAGARRVIGVDNSLRQLRSAQQLQNEFERPFPLVWANAEQVPLAASSCDVVINEYGAAMWCDPYVWIPEAARLLRPGGNLMFLTWSTLMSMSAPDFDHQQTSTQLLRPLRGQHRVVFPDTDGVEFALSHGDWIQLLTSHGFIVDRLIELYAPADGSGPERYSYYDASWARQWPPEEIWVATFRG